MPNARPQARQSLSPIDWLCSFFAWQIVRDTGATIYRQNAITGARSASRICGGHQPIDKHWLETGEWSPPPIPPRGGPLEWRGSIHVNVDGAGLVSRKAGKPRVRVPSRREPGAPADTGGITIRPSA